MASGKEYKLAIRIAGKIDKSLDAAILGTTARLKGLKAVNNDFLKLDQGFNKIMNVGKRALQVIGTASMVAATAVGAVGVAAAKVGMEFEKEMDAVAAISGASSEELDQLTQKARELGETTVFSATEVGKAMEYMGMAGWKTEQMLAGIDGVLNLAAASGEDLAMVSDIVTDNLTAFHMSAEETSRMVDVMAQAAMNSNTNVALMGDTFKYAGAAAGAMGYTIEDIAVATGLMASAGVKGSMAGTALRNMLTRLAKPPKEAAEAIEALNLSLTDDEGNMRSFMDIMKQIRTEMAGMSKIDKAATAAKLAGQRGMTGLLAIAEATDEQFEQLTQSIYNAEGAAQRMADIRLDNLAGDVQLFKDALNDAGIEFEDRLNKPMRFFVQLGTKIVTGSKKYIPEIVDAFIGKLPTIKTMYDKNVKPVIDKVIDFAKWMIAHGSELIGVIAGIATALAGYKAASTAVHVITAIVDVFMSLNPVTAVILAFVAAAGLFVGVLTSIKAHEAELRDSNLAQHFGDIALSLEDLQQAAEHIVGTDALEGVRNALAEFGELEGLSDKVGDAAAEVKKLNWKVSLGIELTEDETTSYKTAIDNYIKGMEEYAQQSQFAVSLNLDVAMGDDYYSGQLSEKINKFYSDSYSEMTQLGSDLNKAVTDAFNDGLLDIHETEKIAEIQEKMAKIKEALATGEFDARLSALSLDKNGGSLTPESFENLQNAIHEQIEAATTDYQESYVKAYSAAKAAMAGGELTIFEFNDAVNSAQSKYLENIANVTQKGFDFQLNTITQQYSKEIDPALSQIHDVYKNAMDKYFSEDYFYSWKDREGLMWEELGNEIRQGTQNLVSSDTGDAIGKLLEDMKPDYEAMQQAAEQYKEAGKAIPQAIVDGINEYDMLTAISGGDADIWSQVGSMLSENESYMQFLEDAGAAGEKIPESIAKGMSSNTAAISTSAGQIATQTNSIVQSAFGQMSVTVPLDISFDANVNLPNIDLGNLASVGTQIKANAPASAGGAAKAAATASKVATPTNTAAAQAMQRGTGHADGIITSQKHLAWVAEKGPEAIIPLNGSQRAFDLWQKTGELMGAAVSGALPDSMNLSAQIGNIDRLPETIDLNARMLGMDRTLEGLNFDTTPSGNSGSRNTYEMAAPVYSPTINVYGSANKSEVEDAVRSSYSEWAAYMQKYQKEQKRLSF